MTDDFAGIEAQADDEGELSQCLECKHWVDLLFHGSYCHQCDQMLEAEDRADYEYDQRKDER